MLLKSEFSTLPRAIDKFSVVKETVKKQIVKDPASWNMTPETELFTVKPHHNEV